MSKVLPVSDSDVDVVATPLDAGGAGDLRPPFTEAHAGDLDPVLAPVDDFVETLHGQNFGPGCKRGVTEGVV